jgi:ABC-type uncharacterized transport system substrate-binding protein
MNMRRLALGGLLMLVSATVPAPPHMWIDATIDVAIDASGLSEVYVDWLFDEFNSAEMIFHLDANLDGRISSAESETIRDSAFAHLASVDYFLLAYVDSGALVVPEASRFRAEVVDGRLRYRFTLPLRVSRDEAEGLILGFFDSSYFIDFLTSPREPGSGGRGGGPLYSEETLTMESEGWGRVRVPAVRIGLP